MYTVSWTRPGTNCVNRVWRVWRVVCVRTPETPAHISIEKTHIHNILKCSTKPRARVPVPSTTFSLQLFRRLCVIRRSSCCCDEDDDVGAHFSTSALRVCVLSSWTLHSTGRQHTSVAVSECPEWVGAGVLPVRNSAHQPNSAPYQIQTTCEVHTCLTVLKSCHAHSRDYTVFAPNPGSTIAILKLFFVHFPASDGNLKNVYIIILMLKKCTNNYHS